MREIVSRELDALDAEQPLSSDHPEEGVVHAALLNQESIELSLFLKGFINYFLVLPKICLAEIIPPG